METHPWDVVIVSSNLENRQDVAAMLFRLGIDPLCLATVDQCRELTGRNHIGLVFCDRKLKDGDYRDVLSVVASSNGRDPKVVMMAELGGSAEYQQVRHQGVFDVIPSPCRPTDVEWMVITARRHNRRVTKGLIEPSRNLGQLWRSAGAGA